MFIAERIPSDLLLSSFRALSASPEGCQFVRIRPHNGKSLNTLSAKNLRQAIYALFPQSEGLIFDEGLNCYTLCGRLGALRNYADFRSEIMARLSPLKCLVQARKISPQDLARLKTRLAGLKPGELLKPAAAQPDSLPLYDQRTKRLDNVVLSIDDASHVRHTLRSHLQSAAIVHERENGLNAAQHYIRHNPDILFLDIHMADCIGLDVIDEIIAADPDAFIIMLSGDSHKTNILEAMARGAFGFMSKPPRMDVLQKYIRTCPTFNPAVQHHMA